MRCDEPTVLVEPDFRPMRYTQKQFQTIKIKMFIAFQEKKGEKGKKGKKKMKMKMVHVPLSELDC